MPKFIGGVKDGQDASEAKMPRVVVVYVDEDIQLARCDNYKKQADGNYHFVSSKIATEWDDLDPEVESDERPYGIPDVFSDVCNQHLPRGNSYSR